MNKTILLAEDSEYDEFFFKEVLKSVGVMNNVVVVRHANRVIEYLKGEGVFADREKFPLPTALFLDLVMPPSDGLVALKWLEGERAFDEMLVIVLTNFTDGKLLREAYALGADTFLFKPFTRSDMKALIQSFPGHWML